MQFYKATIRFNGNGEFISRLPTISAAEGALLRHIHGSDSLVDIELVKLHKDDPRNGLTATQERQRLRRKYQDDHAVNELFGGAVPRLPDTLDMKTEEMKTAEDDSALFASLVDL